MSWFVGLIITVSFASFGNNLVVADDIGDVKNKMDALSRTNVLIELVLGNLEEKADKLREEEEGNEYEAEKAAKLALVRQKREKWTAQLKELEREIANLENYKIGEDNTDGILNGLSGDILDDLNNDARSIKEDINEMKKFLDESIGDVDKLLTSVKKSAVSRNVKVAGVVLHGGVGSACTFSTDCVLAHSECRHGMCQCDTGLSFDSLRNICSRDCQVYGNTYQFTKNMIISNFNNLDLKDKTLAECKQECEREDLGFVCRSMDYFRDWKLCYLSENIVPEVPDSSWIYNGVGIHLQRDCGYTE